MNVWLTVKTSTFGGWGEWGRWMKKKQNPNKTPWSNCWELQWKHYWLCLQPLTGTAGLPLLLVHSGELRGQVAADMTGQEPLFSLLSSLIRQGMVLVSPKWTLKDNQLASSFFMCGAGWRRELLLWVPLHSFLTLLSLCYSFNSRFFLSFIP